MSTSSQSASAGQGIERIFANPARELKVRFRWAMIAIALLIILNQLLVQPAITRLTSDGPVINIAGRQRMLSQKLSKAALALEMAVQQHHGPSISARQAELSEVLTIWQAAHEKLTDRGIQRTGPDLLSPTLRNAFNELQPHFDVMRSAAKQIIDKTKQVAASHDLPPDLSAEVATVLEQEGAFLTRMHQIVGLYEEEARSHIDQLKQTGWWIVLLLLLALLFVNMGVIAPATNTIDRQFAHHDRQYRQLVETTRDAIVVLSPERRIMFANHRLAELLLVKEEQLLESPFENILTRPSRDLFAELDFGAVTPAQSQITLDFLRGDQSAMTGLLVPQVLLDLDGLPAGTLLVITDISAQLKAEHQSRQLKSQLDHARRLTAIGEIAAGLAHEIHQPLGAIANYAEGSLLLIENNRCSIEELKTPLERIRAAALRGGQITRSVRKIAGPSVDIQPEQSLNSLISEVVDLYIPQAEQAQISVNVETDDSIPLLAIDGLQIQQVMTNLLSNAIEAIARTDRHSGVIQVTTHLADLNTVEVSVADDGPGIDPKLSDRLFNAFVTSRQDGVGLGLSISRTIIESHRGSIWAENRPNRGAIFRFRLPTPNQLSPMELVAATA
jgi:PAS domain S-box-containing protein